MTWYASKCPLARMVGVNAEPTRKNCTNGKIGRLRTSGKDRMKSNG